MRRKRITIRMEDGALRRARARAKREGTTLSLLAGQFLKEYLRGKTPPAK
jgi:hypothetical protein